MGYAAKESSETIKIEHFYSNVDAHKEGFIPGERHKLRLVDDAKATYLIDAETGAFANSPQGSVKCNGRRFVSHGKKDEIELIWQAPYGEDAPKITNIVVSKAHGYGALSIARTTLQQNEPGNSIQRDDL